MVEEPNEHVEISILLPVQSGLRHAVWLALQNDDELHLSIGSFWCEWFPCTDCATVAAFVDAVCGFLGGTYRILEHHRAASCFKAELQRPCGESWETVATWSKLRVPSFRKATLNVVTNG